MFSIFKKKLPFLPTLILRDYAVLGAGIAVFVALASSTVTKFSIWFDEAFGSYLIRFDLFELTRYTAYDVHPPLYYWLLKGWTEVFGNTELGMRSMSIFFGAVTLIFAFGLVMRLFGRRAAYLSLLFMVLSPLFIRYGQEARMYTVLTSIILAATYLLVYAMEKAKRRAVWVAYGVLLALGMLTQYFAALAWLAHWAWRALIIKSEGGNFKQKFFTRDWIIAHAVAIGVFLPWLPWVIRQFADVQGNGFWIPAVSSATVPDFLTNFLLFTNHDGAKSWLAAGFYAIFGVTIYLIIRILNRIKGKEQQNYLLLVCMVVVPIVLLLALSMPPLRSAFIDRYLMAAIMFLPILIAVSIVIAARSESRKLLIGFGAIIIVMMGFGIAEQARLGNYNKSTNQSNNVRMLVEKIREQTPSGVPILANTPWTFYEAVVYERDDSPVYFADETTKYEFGSLRMLKENDDHKIKNVEQFADAHDSFWVIGNIKGGPLNKIRNDWNVLDEITINDDVSGKPLFQAVRVSAE
mgnify:CR=1 FL=1